MKRRTDCTKFRRPIKKSKIAEGLSSNTLLYMKFLILWAIVITADFLLEFRFEFLWPFWLLLRSVHDSFKYKGLAFSILFVCIAFTSDLICLFFIPVQWLFFAASTYVWVQYVWHTDKGVCFPTIILWIVFVYLEAAIRWKDSRNMPHLDLCRPFAAHCIGYPVVTLGFGFKSYVGYRIRQRKQREVAKENDFYMQLLQQALPQEETPSCLAQSDQQLQPQEKDPVVVAASNVSTSNHSVNHNYHHKNAQSNSKLLNNNNSTANSLVTNGHVIGTSPFGLSNSSSSTNSSVISNGIGHHSSSSNNSSSSSSRNRKSVDKDTVTMSLSSSTGGGGGGGGGGGKSNSAFHHPASNHISLKDRSNLTNDSSTSYCNEYSSKQHDKGSPKQQHSNSHLYQISNHNSHISNASSSYDEAKSNESSNGNNSKNMKLQNGNLQHDYELPQTVTACQQQESSETSSVSNNIEKERTKSSRKNRGNKANKIQDVSSGASSSSKDNQPNFNCAVSSTTSTSSSAATNNCNNHNTQQDSLFATQNVMFDSHNSSSNNNNNKDHHQVPTAVPVKVCESCPKFEADMKKLRSELNIMKSIENELRQKLDSNSTVKSCLQAKQKENDELHTKLQDMTNLRQIERQTMQNLERRLTEERRQRQSLEAQLNNERKYRKQAEEKAARSECGDACRMKKQQLENEVNKIRREYGTYEEIKHSLEKQVQRYEQELRKMEAEIRSREQQQHSDLITLNDLRMKNATLEKNLSAETRVKLDLFSALGDSKREIEIRDSLLRDRNNELLDLKAKIAQLLAVMPTMPTESFNFASSMPPASSSAGSSILRLSNDGMQQQQQQQQIQSVSPLVHLGLGTGVNSSSLVSQLNLGVLTSTTGNMQTGPNNSLDPNAKTYTPKSNSSLVGGAEA